MRHKLPVAEELICCENRIAAISRQANLSGILSAAQGKQQEVCLMTVDLDPISVTNQSFANSNSIPHNTAPGSWDGVRREEGYFFLAHDLDKSPSWEL